MTTGDAAHRFLLRRSLYFAIGNLLMKRALWTSTRGMRDLWRERDNAR